MTGIALTTLALCFGKYFFLHRFFCNFVPGFSLLRVPFRFLYLYVLSSCFLLAAGFHQMEQETESTKDLPGLVKTGLLFALALCLLSLLRFHQNWRETLALAAGALGLGLFSFRGTKRWGLPLFQTALLVPLLLTGWSDFEVGPSSNYDFSQNTPPTLKTLLEGAKPSRLILDHHQAFYYPVQVHGQKYIVRYPQNLACALPFKNFGGYNPLTLERFNRAQSLPLETLTSLADIQRIVTGEGRGPIPGFTLHPQKGISSYEKTKPLPHVFSPFKIETSAEPDKQFDFLSRTDFFPYSQVVLEEPLPPGVNGKLFEKLNGWFVLGPGHFDYKWLKDDADQQIYEVNLNGPGFAVFSEMMYPGWKAFVDGKESPILTADYLLRAVFLAGAGRHQVEFRFEPAWARPLLWGGFLWLLFTTILFFADPLQAKSRA